MQVDAQEKKRRSTAAAAVPAGGPSHCALTLIARTGVAGTASKRRRAAGEDADTGAGDVDGAGEGEGDVTDVAALKQQLHRVVDELAGAVGQRALADHAASQRAASLQAELQQARQSAAERIAQLEADALQLRQRAEAAEGERRRCSERLGKARGDATAAAAAGSLLMPRCVCAAAFWQVWSGWSPPTVCWCRRCWPGLSR